MRCFSKRTKERINKLRWPMGQDMDQESSIHET